MVTFSVVKDLTFVLYIAFLPSCGQSFHDLAWYSVLSSQAPLFHDIALYLSCILSLVMLLLFVMNTTKH